MSAKYEKNIYLAMLAEQCNRFDEMVQFLEDMLKSREKDLSNDERNILSIAYKNSVSSKNRPPYHHCLRDQGKKEGDKHFPSLHPRVPQKGPR